MLRRTGDVHGGRNIGWMAERSKALVSGTSLFGGEGSNPSSVTYLFVLEFSNVRIPPIYVPVPGRMSRLAQLVERKTLNLVVVGSSPTMGVTFCIFCTGFSSLGRRPRTWPCFRSCGAVGSA